MTQAEIELAIITDMAAKRKHQERIRMYRALLSDAEKGEAQAIRDEYRHIDYLFVAVGPEKAQRRLLELHRMPVAA